MQMAKALRTSCPLARMSANLCLELGHSILIETRRNSRGWSDNQDAYTGPAYVEPDLDTEPVQSVELNKTIQWGAYV